MLENGPQGHGDYAPVQGFDPIVGCFIGLFILFLIVSLAWGWFS